MRRGRQRAARLLLELAMMVAAAIFLFPFYVLLTISFRPPSEVTEAPLAPPTSLFLGNYTEAWSTAALGQALVNSVTVTALSIALLVVIGSLTSYWLARRQTRLSYWTYLMFVAGLVLPLQLAMIPLYQFMNALNLLGTYTSLIIFYTGHLLPLTVFLYTGFIRALPRSYEECALTDGATHAQAFRRIVFPLLRPVTGTTVILNGIFIWNDFLTPFLYVGGSSQQTIPIAIFAFVGQYSSQWNLVFAGLSIGMLPMLIIYFAFQRTIIRGFATGLKG